MNELHCRGTPAQIARCVLDVLWNDPDLLWLVNVRDFYPPDKMQNLDYWGRTLPGISDDQQYVHIGVFSHDVRPFGHIELKTMPGYTLVTAHRRAERETYENGQMKREIVDRFDTLASIWARVRAEFERLGLVVEMKQDRAPRVPHRQADLNKWRACWRKIKPEWRRGRAYFEIRQWLDAQDSSLAYSEDILAEIITAGEAGLLDAD